MAFPDTDLGVSIKAYLGANPTAAPGTWPAPVDLSSRLLDAPMRISGGRGQGQNTLQSMQATLELDNTDGYLTPLNPMSPYYGTWDLGVPVLIDVTNVGASPPYGLMRGYVASIKPKIQPGAGGVDWQTVTVTLGGVMRRLGMGDAPLKSALYRYISKHANTVGYWPLDEPAGALEWRDTAGAHTAVIDPAAATSAVLSAGEDLAPWLETGLKISANSTVRHRNLAAIFQPGAGGALTFSWVGRFLDNTSAGQMFAVAEDNTFIFAFSFARESNANPNQLELFVEDNSTPVYNVARPELSLLSDTPLLFTLQLSNSGANVAWTAWVDTPSARVVSISGTKTTAQVQAPRYCAVGSNGGNGVVFGHMAAFNAAVDPASAFRGYSGETAGSRLTRLCSEEGIPVVVSGTGAPVGQQSVGLDVTEHLRQIEAADHGLLYELTNDWGIGYRTLQQRYNLQPSMTVDLSTYRTGDDPGVLLQPVRDDSRLRNEWAVTREGGAEPATAVDSANQAKRGRYNDSATVNVAMDSQADDLAHWLLHETTYDRLSYGALSLDPGSNPTLLTAFLASAVGDRVDIVNALLRFYVDDIRLVYEGRTHTIGRRNWKTQLSVQPYDVYRVATVGTAGLNIAGSDSATIAEDLTTTETLVDINCGAGPDWVYEVDVDILIGGERMTVKAVTAAAGTFPNRTHTLTVTRSVNGVVKTHTTGAAISMADPVYEGL